MLPDSVYIRLAYFITYGRLLRLKNPRLYSEKIQWLKLHQTQQIYSDLVDKYKVRDYIRKKIGEDVLIPLYWHGTDASTIPYDILPNSFVIKCNHGSKYNILVHDKKKLDILDTKKNFLDD